MATVYMLYRHLDAYASVLWGEKQESLMSVPKKRDPAVKLTRIEGCQWDAMRQDRDSMSEFVLLK